MRPFVLFLLLLLAPAITQAHEIRPGYLEIKEAADQSLQITWKQPLMGEYGVPMHPSLSAGWLVDSLARMSYTEAYLIQHWHIPPEHAALDGQTIRIAGLERTMTDVLVHISLLNGVSFTHLLKPIQPFVVLNLSKPQALPVWQYLQLGMHHIWFGFDHLLFVLGLLLLVPDRSRLVWTITAFTVAHSITLALATLHIVDVPGAFIEALIALSIVFVAVELLNHYRGQNGFAYRYPWMVSFFFGLLHGLGFAGALQDVGLPEKNIPFALLLFNVGVEIGQLVFVIAVLAFMTGMRWLPFVHKPWMRYVAPYAIGGMAAFWVIERVLGMFP